MVRLEDAAEVPRARIPAPVGHRIEFLAGTNPLDDNSALRITDIEIVGNDVEVSWTTVVGRTN